MNGVDLWRMIYPLLLKLDQNNFVIFLGHYYSWKIGPSQYMRQEYKYHHSLNDTA